VIKHTFDMASVVSDQCCESFTSLQIL